MSERHDVWRLVGTSFVSAVAASLVVLLIGMVLFGFELAQWAEWEGRLVGVVGTLAGAGGAAAGLAIGLRADRRRTK